MLAYLSQNAMAVVISLSENKHYRLFHVYLPPKQEILYKCDVFSNLSSVNCDCDLKPTPQTEYEIWDMEHGFTAKAEFIENGIGTWL